MSNMLVIRVKDTPESIVIEDGVGSADLGYLDVPASGWCGQVKALDLDPIIISDR